MKKIIFWVMAAIIFSGSAMALEYGQVNIHGYLSQGVVKSDKYDYYYANTSEGSVEFNELGINFSTKLSDQLRAGMQLRASDMGEIGNNNIFIDWAYGDYKFNDFLGVRVGKFRKATGVYNETRDIDASRTSIFLPNSVIYSEPARDVASVLRGVNVYGKVMGFDYQIMGGLRGVTIESGFARSAVDQINSRSPVTLEEADRSFEDVDEDPSYTLHLVYNTPFGLSIGSTIDYFSLEYINENPDLIENFKVLGYNNCFFLKYVLGELIVVAELFSQESEIEIFTSIDIPGMENPIARDISLLSYHLVTSYRFTEWFELGCFYTEYFEDKDDRDGKEQAEEWGLLPASFWLKDFALSTRFDINDYWIVKLEGHMMNGLNGVDFSSRENPDEDWYLVAAKVTYTF